MSSSPRRRCAIYTRKSTEEGLDQAFNTLDAQREACEAYILSQAGEGWECLPDRYDDGGWSGGNMDRPALKSLLADIARGRIDIVVVYKVDRLTRSLADFAKIVEILDEKGASFVSVTQAFNTTTSMGRLTLNVLLSFAQFEREVTGERIRDKIAASKRKGMWMGGAVPHGYYVHERKLLIDAREAEEIRYIFKRYLETKSILRLADDLAAKGMRTRERTLGSGRTIGNVNFGKGALGSLLKNQVYIGKTKHKDAIYDGEHEAIIDLDTFNAVQALMASNNRDKLLSRAAKSPSLLSGFITDPDGRAMSPTRGQNGGRQYCYYVTRFKPGDDRSTRSRLPAGEVDRIVIEALATYLRNAPQADDSTCKVEWSKQAEKQTAVADSIHKLPRYEQRALLIDHGAAVQVNDASIDVTFVPNAGYDTKVAPTTISTPARLVRRGNELRIALPPDGRAAEERRADPGLVRLVAQGFAAREHVMTGKPIEPVCSYGRKHLHRLVRISWLAPDIISAILEGRQPVQLTANHLKRCAEIPMDWQQQRKFLGFG